MMLAQNNMTRMDGQIICSHEELAVTSISISIHTLYTHSVSMLFFFLFVSVLFLFGCWINHIHVFLLYIYMVYVCIVQYVCWYYDWTNCLRIKCLNVIHECIDTATHTTIDGERERERHTPWAAARRGVAFRHVWLAIMKHRTRRYTNALYCGHPSPIGDLALSPWTQAYQFIN